jgi:hypothetical protein
MLHLLHYLNLDLNLDIGKTKKFFINVKKKKETDNKIGFVNYYLNIKFIV